MISLHTQIDALSVGYENIESTWHAWVGLTDSLTTDAAVRAWLPLVDFLDSVARSLLASTFLGLCQFYDTGRNDLSLYWLLDKAQAAEPSLTAEIGSLRDSIHVVAEPLQRIRRPRNKIYAHRDSWQSPAQTLASSGVLPGDIWAVLHNIDGILGILRQLFGTSYKRPADPTATSRQAAEAVHLVQMGRSALRDVG